MKAHKFIRYATVVFNKLQFFINKKNKVGERYPKQTWAMMLTHAEEALGAEVICRSCNAVHEQKSLQLKGQRILAELNDLDIGVSLEDLCHFRDRVKENMSAYRKMFNECAKK